MCLVVWKWQPETASPLILLSNRDEFYSRPTLPLHWWDERVLAGKDLQEGGTWLGVSRAGKLAVLTNYRSAKERIISAPTRGKLVADFLRNDESIDSYLNFLSSVGQSYNPFNLLLYDGSTLKGFESNSNKVIDIKPGIGGLSNAQFDTPWPKLKNLKNQLNSCLQINMTDPFQMLSLLSDDTLASDEDLPITGLPYERERSLSACFIKTIDYGTRTSSFVHFRNRNVCFVEQGYNNVGKTELVRIDFKL